MKPEHWITLANLLLTTIGLYFGPKLAVRRALEQFRSQRWWESREDLYTSLLQQLSVLRDMNYGWIERYGLGRIAGELLDSEKEQGLAARTHIIKSLEFGSYLISDQAAKALRAALNPKGESAMEYYEDMADKLTEAITIIKEEACLMVKPA